MSASTVNRAKRGDMGLERVETVAAPPLALEIVWCGGRVVALRLGRAKAARLDSDATPEARAVQAAN